MYVNIYVYVYIHIYIHTAYCILNMHILNLPQTALFGQNTWVSFSAYLCKTLFVVARFCLTAVFWDAHCFHVFVLCHKL